jgi:ABC-2 type transport system ATP-binding protein
MNLLCQFENVTKRYADTLAVDNASGKIHEGAAIALLGPNGGGKSTLLGLIGGLYRPASGRVDFPSGKPSMHVVSHHSQLYSRLSVKENLRYFAALYNLKEQNTLMKAAQATGIAPHLHKRAEELSRGLLQRAVLAILLMHDPEFLLLDEAFTGLDTEGQSLLEKIIKRKLPGFENLKYKVLMITDHDFARALHFSNEVMLIAQGKILTHQKAKSMSAQKINHLLFGAKRE